MASIKPPPTPHPEPDEDTKKYPPFTDGGAPGQVLHFSGLGISYGTDDKSHAASLILAIVSGLLLFIVCIIGLCVDRNWIPDALKIIGSIFTFTSGVAIGKGKGS